MTDNLTFTYPDPDTCDIGHRLITNDPIRITRTAFGWFMWNKNDTGVGHSLRVLGEYAVQEINNLARLINPGDVVLDIGAYIGTHTISFARKVAPTGMVIAFEPMLNSYQTMCANLLTNGIVGVHTIHQAIGAKSQFVPLPTVQTNTKHDFGHIDIPQLERIRQQNQGLSLSTTPVPMATLDTIKTKSCRLIKINTPGSEADIITHGQHYIRQHTPILNIALYPATDIPAIASVLGALGYDFYRHDTKLYRSYNAAKLREDPFKENQRQKHAILAVSKNEHEHIEGIIPDLKKTSL